jgi:hypothetical protein
MISILQIFLVLLVLGLFTATFYACFSFKKGPLSMSDLKARLLLLKARFADHSPVDPEEERRMMEGLQNKVKTTCSRETISANAGLRALFQVNCQSVNAIIATAKPIDKTQWVRYGALMNDFHDQYFPNRRDGEPQPQ